jgi:hypothetical protein
MQFHLKPDLKNLKTPSPHTTPVFKIFPYGITMSATHRIVALDNELKLCVDELDTLKGTAKRVDPEIQALEAQLFGSELHEAKPSARRVVK